MKAISAFSTLAISALILSGCSQQEKNPVTDLEQLRKLGATEVARGPEKPQILTETIVVEKPVAVIKEQATISSDSVVIAASPYMSFNEGQSSSFEVIAQSLIPGVRLKLSAKNLPAGAQLNLAPSADQKDRYLLSWTPAFNSVVTGASLSKEIKIKLVAEVAQAPDEKVRQTLSALLKEKEVVLVVSKNRIAPSELRVENLPEQVLEDSITPFQVLVTVPGVDDQSLQKPILRISYDGVSLTQGNSYREMDGSRHIILNENKKEAEYLGQFKWKFNLLFDTKNISLQPALKNDGSVDALARASHLRLSLKVYNESLSTPESVKKIQVTLIKSVEAPRFEVLGLAQESLELTPGERIRLSFTVKSANTKSLVKVERPDLKSLVGSPQITCVASALTTAEQKCQLQWNIPCSAKDSDLTQEISLSAVATMAGRSSEVVKYTLKTIRSAKLNASCVTGAKK
jgi:hypothetical protein